MKQIIAMGGGSFGSEPRNPLLDQFILAQSKAARPKVCFISTASGDSDNYIRKFIDMYSKLPCEPSYLSLFNAPIEDLACFLSDKDIIYVGGGNTRNMLVLWQEWGLDRILRDLYDDGKVLAGVSAGSLCWFEEGVTDSIPGRLSRLQCLGFLKGSNCPHYDGEADRRPSYHKLLLDGAIGEGLAADDGAAFHFVDGNLREVVTSRVNAGAYRVFLRSGEVQEERLPTRFLGPKA